MCATNPRKNEAELLAQRILMGTSSVLDAVSRADSVIEAEEHPHWTVCELATLARKQEQEVVEMLRAVPGDADEAWVDAQLLTALLVALEAPHNVAMVAQALMRLESHRMLAETLYDLGSWADDALDLADAGITGDTRESIAAEMRARLDEVLRKAVPRSA